MLQNWNKNKRIQNCIWIAVALLGVWGLILLEQKLQPRSPLQEYYAYLGTERIQMWEQGEERYLFLPSYASRENLFYSKKLKKVEFQTLSSAHLDTIFLDTESGSLDSIYENKENKERGKIRIYNENGEQLLSTGLAYIKGRGNYTWTNWDKKSFSIVLEQSRSLLGLPEGKKYVLFANASDDTLLRNHIGRALEEALELSFSHTGKYVDLYINGNYMGNYYLVDALELGESRINVASLEETMGRYYQKQNSEKYEIEQTGMRKAYLLPENPEDITGGYLLEREFGERFRLEMGEIGGGLTTKSGECIIIKSPNQSSKEEIEYLEHFLNDLEQALKETDSSYQEYLDIDTFSRKYLAEELMKNYDASVSSSFFYKDSDTRDGRLKGAPGWDYDMSLGNYLDWMEYTKEDGAGFTKLQSGANSSWWWSALLEKEDFRQQVTSLYKEKAAAYLQKLMEEEIPMWEEQLQPSAQMDAIRWHSMYSEKGYFPTEPENYQKLQRFIGERKQFFDKLWGDS